MEDKYMLAEINVIISKKDNNDTWTALANDIENNNTPWTKGWDGKVGAAINALPMSGSSGRPYTGYNKFFLMQTLQQIKKVLRNINKANDEKGDTLSENQVNDPRFFTFKQIADKGYHLLKGSKSLPIVMWFKYNTDKDGNPLPLEEQRWVKTYTNVFHASQIRQAVPVLDADGNKIPVLDKDGNQKMTKSGEFVYQMEYIPIPEYQPRFRAYTHEETNELIEILLKKSGASISHDNADENFYSPTRDELHLTPKESYPDINDYYRTVLHELSHWTGHASRLNRNINNQFGTKDYAREELRAETAAAFLCCDFNIPLSPNHGAYLKNWLQQLNNDPKELEMAQRDAHRIINYIGGLVRDKIKELEPIRENPDADYKDHNKNNKGKDKSPEKSKKPTKAESSNSILSVAIYKPMDGAKWRGQAFTDTIKAKLPVDFTRYTINDIMVVGNTGKDIMDAFSGKKGSADNIALSPGDVIQVADRLFYINKPGNCSDMAENNFYQEVTLRNFKNMKIMAPLEGETREKIKAEQIKLIGQEAFDAYRQQFRDVIFEGSQLKSEDCLNNIEQQYKKFIYDHAFEYGYSGIRPCDQMAWQKADSDFCINYFAESVEPSASIMDAISIVEKLSPYAAGHKDIEYGEQLTATITKEPTYQKAKKDKAVWEKSQSVAMAAVR